MVIKLPKPKKKHFISPTCVVTQALLYCVNALWSESTTIQRPEFSEWDLARSFELANIITLYLLSNTQKLALATMGWQIICSPIATETIFTASLLPISNTANQNSLFSSSSSWKDWPLCWDIEAQECADLVANNYCVFTLRVNCPVILLLCEGYNVAVSSCKCRVVLAKCWQCWDWQWNRITEYKAMQYNYHKNKCIFSNSLFILGSFTVS